MILSPMQNPPVKRAAGVLRPRPPRFALEAPHHGRLIYGLYEQYICDTPLPGDSQPLHDKLTRRVPPCRNLQQYLGKGKGSCSLSLSFAVGVLILVLPSRSSGEMVARALFSQKFWGE